MSLVAAVAVAGLTTANAKPLEEAIKNVDVSGTVVYRYDDSNAKNAAHTSTNKYKIGLNLSSKVNDDVKLNTRFLVASANGDFAGPLNTSSGNDVNPGVTLSNVYFSYTGIANTTVNVGKQGLTTPWTVAIDSDGNEDTGTGILALSSVGPVTVAAAYFNQTNLQTAGKGAALFNGNEDLIVLAAMGNVGPVSLDAWYLDAADVFDTYTLGAKANFDVSGVKLGADLRYTSLDLDNATTDNDMVKLTLTAKAGIVDAKLAYAKTDKQGGVVSLNNDALTDIQGWSVSLSGLADADYVQAVVGVQATDTVHISANYVNVEYLDTTAGANATADEEQEELYAQLVYNMSKNLSTYVRFGTQENKIDGATSAETDYKGRLQVQYSF